MMNTTAFRSLAWAVAVLAGVALVFVAIILGSRQQTTPAQAQYTGHGAVTRTDTTRDPFSFGVVSPCTPAQDQYAPKDVFTLEGTLHTVSHTTRDPNGVFHTKFVFNLQGQGEGQLSGDKYVFHDVFNFHQNFRGAAMNFTQTRTFNIIRQGSATTTDDLQGKIVFHTTVNAQGEVTTEVVKIEEVCK